jgi:solute carrier family 35 protein E1
VLFYLYNEVSFKVLDKVHPVTHALANTFKRIVIILSSIIVFKNPISLGGAVGSSLALIGVTLYSLISSK